MKKKYLLFLPLLLFIFIPYVKADSANLSLSGNNSVEVGKEISITLRTTSVSGEISAFVGDIEFDTSFLQMTGKSGMTSPYGCGSLIQQSANKYRMRCQNNDTLDTPNVTGAQVIYTVKFKALKAGDTTINFINTDLSDANGDPATGNEPTKTITITEPKQDEPTSTDGGNNTSNTDSGNNASDNKKTETKTDNKKSEDKKDTTVKKDGSKDNSLASLSVEGYEIKFNKNTLNYSIDVKYDVEGVKVDAKANDSKAKVDIIGDSGLKYGPNNVKVVVTAENGDKKTYTIVVTREADPNKELKSVNDLEGIKPSVGMLSPAFDKDKTNYVVYLPYEVKEISFEVTLADSSSSLEKEEAEVLKVGNNTYKYSVRAENGNMKTYTVTVRRFGEYEKSNTKLKAINIDGGKLLLGNGSSVKDFNGDIKDYLYSKGKDFSISAVAEDENAIVKTIIDGDKINIIVEAPNGDYSVYTLNKYNFFGTIWFILILFVLGFGIGFTCCLLIRKFKKNKMVKSL